MPDLPGIIMVLEGTSDVRVIRGFAERALLEQDSDFDTNLFSWRGLDDNTEFLQWTGLIKELIRKQKTDREHGHFKNELSDDPGEPYAKRTRDVLQLCHKIGMP